MVFSFQTFSPYRPCFIDITARVTGPAVNLQSNTQECGSGGSGSGRKPPITAVPKLNSGFDGFVERTGSGLDEKACRREQRSIHTNYAWSFFPWHRKGITGAVRPSASHAEADGSILGRVKSKTLTNQRLTLRHGKGTPHAVRASSFHAEADGSIIGRVKLKTSKRKLTLVDTSPPTRHCQDRVRTGWWGVRITVPLGDSYCAFATLAQRSEARQSAHDQRVSYLIHC